MRGEARCPNPARGLSPARAGLASWSQDAWCWVSPLGRHRGCSGAACSLGPLGIYEATVPPGGCVVLRKGRHPVPWAFLSTSLSKVCCHHFTNEV